MKMEDLDYAINSLVVCLLISLVVILVVAWVMIICARSNSKSSEVDKYIKTAFIICICVACVLTVVAVICESTNHARDRQYGEAVIKERNGDYIGAYALYKATSSKSESETAMARIYVPYRYQVAERERANGNLLDAVIIYAEIPEFKDSEQLLKDTWYR